MKSPESKVASATLHSNHHRRRHFANLRPYLAAGLLALFCSSLNAESLIPLEPHHTRLSDIPYAVVEGVDPNLLSLDLYVPEGVDGKHPVLIMIHGGGWRRGDKASTSLVQNKMRHFVGEGYIFASINYRLSPMEPGDPEIIHPIHAEDAARAIAFIHNTVARHGGDPDRIHLMGHSAGAHIAGIVGTNERFLGELGKPLSIIKTNVLLDTAALDIPGYLEKSAGPAMQALYKNAFGTDPKNLLDASPFHHVEAGKDIPPTLLFYAGQRMALNEYAPAFVEKMRAFDIPAAAVDTVSLEHREINVNIGMVGEPMTELIMRLHAGEDPKTFPREIPAAASAAFVNRDS